MRRAKLTVRYPHNLSRYLFRKASSVQVVSSKEEFQWLLLVVMGFFLSLLPESVLWMGCLGAILVVGIPHGAFDIYLLWFHSKKNLYLFFSSISKYLLLVFLALLFWKQWPELFWALFFFAAIYHFGSSDEHPEVLATISSRSLFKTLWILSRGTVLVLAPAAFHPQKIANYLSYAAPEHFAQQLPQIAPFLCGYAAVLYLWTTFQCWKKSGLLAYRWILMKHLASLIVLVLLFVVADPLLSFSLYFCCHHSLSHTFRVLARFQNRVSGKGLAVTLVLTTLSVIPLLFWVEKHFALRTTSDGIVTAAFVGIAALTFPHLVVVHELHKTLYRKFRLFRLPFEPQTVSK